MNRITLDQLRKENIRYAPALPHLKNTAEWSRDRHAVVNARMGQNPPEDKGGP